MSVSMTKVFPSDINNDIYFEKNPKAGLSKVDVPNGNNTGVTLSYKSLFVVVTVGCLVVIGVCGTLIGLFLHEANHTNTRHEEQQNKEELNVDLDGTDGVTGSLPGYSIHSSVTGPKNRRSCSRQAVIKVTFSRLSQFGGVCWSGAYGPRQMLKIQMYFSDKNRALWMFDIGDSVSNNGYAGDNSDSDFSAEVQGLGTTISAWANTRQPETVCKAQQLSSFADSLSSSVKVVTVYVANHFLKVTNDQGLNNTSCDECLYGLNGQYDKRAGGTGNEDIYLAFNRVVYHNSRNGYGLCSVKIQWVTDPNQ